MLACPVGCAAVQRCARLRALPDEPEFSCPFSGSWSGTLCTADQKRYWKGDGAAYSFTSPQAIAAAFYGTTEPGQALVRELEQPFKQEGVDMGAIITTKCATRRWEPASSRRSAGEPARRKLTCETCLPRSPACCMLLHAAAIALPCCCRTSLSPAGTAPALAT
jgi:hypothetical protein